jgi:PAS domain S-box-containing protein
MERYGKLTGILTSCAVLLAIAIAVGIPAGYYLTSSASQHTVVETEAYLNSTLLSQAIGESPGYWRYEDQRLAEILARLSSMKYVEQRTVRTVDNEIIVRTGAEVPPPVLTVSHPLYDAGEVVGSMEISSSLRPLLFRTAMVSLVSLVIGLAVYLTLRFFPLRALSTAMLGIYEEKERALALLNNIPDIAWLKDRDDRYIAVNGPFGRMCGIHPREVTGKTDREIWPAELAEGYRAEDREVVKTGRSKQIEEQIVDAEGRRSWILTTKTPVFNARGEVVGTTGIARDITERRRMENELRESRQYLLDIIQFYPDATVVIDRDGKVVAWNRAMEELSGVRAEEMLGKGDYEYALPFYGERRPLLIDLAMKSLDGMEERYENIERHGDTICGEAYIHNRRGETFYFHGTAAPLRTTGGELIGAIESIRDITARQKMEELLREKEERLETITRTARDAIVMIDARGRISFWNPAAETIFGHTAAETLGRELHGLIAPRRYHEDFNRGFARFSQNGQGVAVGRTLELVAVRSSGEEFPVELSLAAIQLRGEWHAVGVMRDITQRKLAEAETLRRGDLVERLNASLVDLARDARLYSGDMTSAFRAITEASARAMGVGRVSIWLYTGDESGIRCVDLYDATDGSHSHGMVLGASAYPAYFAALRTGCPIDAGDAVNDPRTAEFAEYYLRPLGIAAMLDVPCRVAGRVVGIVCHEHRGAPRVWDVEEQSFATAIAGFASMAMETHERRLAEERVRAMNDQLERMVDERTRQLVEAQDELVRREKLAILGQLSGSVGHELRNPLGVMSNAVYFLKMVLTGADETTREYLEIIRHEIDNSLRIISDLLDFARTKTPQIAAVAVRELVEENLGRCTLADNVRVALDMPDSLPLLSVDPLQLGQVLQNLFTNAVQAMPGGGELRVTAVEAGRFVELAVSDTGEGISPENMKKLFQPLFTTKARGIGLGLVVCRNLVEANHGEIGVSSRPGEGTTFTLTLPVAEAGI